MIQLQGTTIIMMRDEKLKIMHDNKLDYKDGRIVTIQNETFEILANVQPLNAKDLLLVPEYNRYKEQYYLFTEWDEGCCKPDVKKIKTGDMIIRKDREKKEIRFEVQGTEDWGNYIRAHIMKIDTGEYANQ